MLIKPHDGNLLRAHSTECYVDTGRICHFNYIVKRFVTFSVQHCPEWHDVFHVMEWNIFGITKGIWPVHFYEPFCSFTPNKQYTHDARWITIYSKAKTLKFNWICLHIHKIIQISCTRWCCIQLGRTFGIRSAQPSNRLWLWLHRNASTETVRRTHELWKNNILSSAFRFRLKSITCRQVGCWLSCFEWNSHFSEMIH